jgi:hypothetical protein
MPFPRRHRNALRGKPMCFVAQVHGSQMRPAVALRRAVD